ncbi:MAG: alpha/beta hydrolase [Planctomycetota bacterium]|nr:alpha/beta hydrolase [Planctomycetota bacterium]
MIHPRIVTLLAAVIALLVIDVPNIYADQPDHVINLWPGEPPGENRKLEPEQDLTKDSDKLIAGRRIIKLGNVLTPQAHVYLPPANRRTGASVVICPGGGFSILAWDLEGTEVAQWLNTLGVAGIVLKYRVPTGNQDPRWLAPVQDAQRTVSLVRHHAKEWKLDTDKVGILGFSAGGVAAFKTSLASKRHYEAVDPADEASCRPDRTILIYSAGLPKTAAPTSKEAPSDHDQKLDQIDIVTPKSPPMFIVHAFDDFVPVEGAANLLLALKRAGVASELRVYDAGGHGYGLRKQSDLPVTHWTNPCEAWLRRAEWID